MPCANPPRKHANIVTLIRPAAPSTGKLRNTFRMSLLSTGRSATASLALTFLCLVQILAAPGDTFDLADRKDRLPWIWQPPQPQSIPAVQGTPPATDIDHFIRARLDQHHLKPAPPVSDAAWLRRTHFVITGLPPSREALLSFLSDTAPDRRPRAVDALLASPHFGERWARHWMDLMRYAESRGHEFDYTIANAWQYRDYLIRAFNDDLPYDRFLSEHLAGDLLPPRFNPQTGAHESILATGWAFLGEEPHSPVDIRLDECERVDNKIDVLSKAFLGLTVSCARCHDHKFDALTQRDYYALSGFLLGSGFRQVRFDTAVEHERIGTQLEALRQSHRLPLASNLVAHFRPALDSLPTRLLEAFSPHPPASWTNQVALAAKDPAHPLHPFTQRSRETTPAQHPAAQPRVIADYTRPGTTLFRSDGPGFGPHARSPGDFIPGGIPAEPLLRILPLGGAVWDGFWNRLALAPGNEPDPGSLASSHRAGRTLRTPSVLLGSGNLHYLIRGRARVYAAVDSHIMIAGPLHGALMATFDTGSRIAWVTHKLDAYAGHRAHVEFAPEANGPLEVFQVVESDSVPPLPDSLSWRPDSPVDSPAALAQAFTRDCARALGALASDSLNREPRLATVADWLFRHPELLDIDPATLAQAAQPWSSARDALATTVRWESRTAVAWLDGSGVDAHVLVRGKPGRHAEPAPRSLPSALGLDPIQPSDTSGRLELARQLTQPSNPLVARVFVNRVWHHLFGRGIVPTTDNFGFLGERPTHPELLDHLAWHFIHSDQWSLKRLVRRLVLTDTFATGSTTPSSQAAQTDPSNLLWHRIPVRRLEAETIRDSLLTVSGRLDPATGGPPIPVHLTEFANGRGRPEKDGPLDGAGRRSLYTAVRRNFMPPLLVAFDFPTPFSTMGRRNRTNVPGQALALMNDPFVHQQARFWAERLLRSTPDSDEARINWLFETAFSRSPRPDEVLACRESLAELRSLDPDPVAVWSDLGHALFNTSEFIYLP